MFEKLSIVSTGNTPYKNIKTKLNEYFTTGNIIVCSYLTNIQNEISNVLKILLLNFVISYEVLDNISLENNIKTA